jgi:hypothetical protein
MNLSPKRLYFVLIGVIATLGLMSIGAAVLGSSMLTQKNQKLTELKLESEVLVRQKQDVITAKANIQKYEELESLTKQIVPQEKDQAKTVREIVRFANSGDVPIQSISFPASNLGKQAAPAPKTQDKEASAASAPAAPPVTQVQPVSGLNDVFEMEVVVTSGAGSNFDSLINFLKDLESNRRTSQVSLMTITPDGKDRTKLSFTINFKVYIKP